MTVEYTVEQIEQDAMITHNRLTMLLECQSAKAKARINALLKSITLKGLLSYTERTLFLIDEIKKLKMNRD